MRISRYPLFFCPLLCFCLLFSACGSNTLPVKGTGTPTATSATPIDYASPPSSPSPLPTASPARVENSCPHIPVMPALSRGSHQKIVYLVTAYDGKTPTSTLKRYDVTTGSTTDIVKISNALISDAVVSSDGQWVLFAATDANQAKLQIIRIDGQDLQTLYCTKLPTNGANPSGALDHVQWSSNQKLVVFSTNDGEMDLLNMQDGSIQREFTRSKGSFGFVPITWLDNTRVYLRLLSFDDYSFGFYILDTSLGPNQNWQQFHPIVSGYGCGNFDRSYDGTQLFVSQCNFTDPRSGSAKQEGPSSITVEPAAGGSQQTIYSTPTLAIIAVRAIPKQTLLLLIDNRSGDTSQNGLWKINTDGTGLTRLSTDSAGQPSYLNEYSQYPWSSVSRDGSLYAFEQTGPNVANVSDALLFGSLSSGSPTVFASKSNDTEVYLVGWTTL